MVQLTQKSVFECVWFHKVSSHTWNIFIYTTNVKTKKGSLINTCCILHNPKILVYARRTKCLIKGLFIFYTNRFYFNSYMILIPAVKIKKTSREPFQIQTGGQTKNTNKKIKTTKVHVNTAATPNLTHSFLERAVCVSTGEYHREVRPHTESASESELLQRNGL